MPFGCLGVIILLAIAVYIMGVGKLLALMAGIVGICIGAIVLIVVLGFLALYFLDKM